MQKKIIVAHPEKQHSQKMAIALYKENLLQKYITTAYYKKYNLTSFLDKVTRGKFKLSSNRKISVLPDDKVKQFLEFRGLLLLILRRYIRGKFINKLQNFNFDKFGKKVAQYAKKENVCAVVMYDTNSMRCFELLKETEIIKIMDTSIANRAYTKSIYANVIKDIKEWDHFSEKNILLDPIEMDRLLNEISLTDYFIVPSNFVKESLLFSGVKEEQIYIVPYGVDINLFQYNDRRSEFMDDKLELLFVGECSYRKGINYLLEACANLNGKVNLTIVGGYHRILDLYNLYHNLPNINFLGRVNHDELPGFYKKADIFVLPSLSEGMSLVGLEAMACGIPVLCSKNCGVNDLVTEGYNGWLLSEISSSHIENRLNYILKHTCEISKMGKNARLVAEKHTWDQYTINMQKTIKKILKINDIK